MLTALGCDAAACLSGPAAQTATSGPDVYVLDLDLAGADEVELARQIRERAGGRPPGLVAVTG